MLNESKAKGLVTELQCQCFFTSLKYNISIPLGEDCKYDFILDIGNKLLRIQVKTCHQEENGIEFSTKSTYLTSKGSISSSYMKDDIDFFATYYNNNCYLIPVEQCGGSSKKLLFKEFSQKNNKNIAHLDEYEASKILDKLIHNKKLPNEEGIELMQYSLDNVYIRSFSSYGEAAKSLGKSQSSHIGQCAKGLRKTAYGYIWKLREEN